MLYQMWLINQSSADDRADAARSDEERASFNRILAEAHEASGARAVLLANCLWADERYRFWGITTFPSLQARMDQTRRMQEGGIYQNFNSFSLLGSSDQEIQFPSFPNPIYALWYVKTDPAAIAAMNSLSKEARDRMHAEAQKSIDENNVCEMLLCSCYWSNCEYSYFGVEAYPSLDSLQKHSANLQKLNWGMYYPGVSILGTKR